MHLELYVDLAGYGTIHAFMHACMCASTGQVCDRVRVWRSCASVDGHVYTRNLAMASSAKLAYAQALAYAQTLVQDMHVEALS